MPPPNLHLLLAHYCRISPLDVRAHCEATSPLSPIEALILLHYQIAHLTLALQSLAEDSGDTDAQFVDGDKVPVGH